MKPQLHVILGFFVNQEINASIFSSNKNSKSILKSKTEYRWEQECVLKTCEHYEEYVEGAENHLGRFSLRSGMNRNFYKQFYIKNYKPSDSILKKRYVLESLAGIVRSGKSGSEIKRRNYSKVQTNNIPGKLESSCTKLSSCSRSWKNKCSGKSYNSSNWMQILNDESLASELNLPGTHNSYALRDADGSISAYILNKPVQTDNKYAKNDKVEQSLVVTQSMPVEDQIKLGVRVIDARMVIDEKLEQKLIFSQRPITFSHHNVIQYGNIKTQISGFLNFLEQTPSEFIVVKYKQEFGDISVSDIKYNVKSACNGFCRKAENCDKKCVFEEHRQSGTWFGSKVKDLRGKIVFWPKTEAIGSTKSWLQKRNPLKFLKYSLSVSDSGFEKDVYEYFETSWHMAQNRGSVKNKPFIFYLSGNGMHKKYGPFCIATGKKCGNDENNLESFGLNSLMMRKLVGKRESDLKLGLVMMDFPGAHLVRRITDLNCE